MEESLTLEQQGEAAQEFLAGLVREFGLDADVDFAELDEDTVQVAATGDDLGLLVGPRGPTLAAVQDLTRTFVQRQSENRTDRILVDVGGYREKRTAALRRFTEGIVDEVKSSGEERALEPMSPADRKVIHDTVNEIDGVETRSDGIEPSRYVVIQLAGSGRRDLLFGVPGAARPAGCAESLERAARLGMPRCLGGDGRHRSTMRWDSSDLRVLDRKASALGARPRVRRGPARTRLAPGMAGYRSRPSRGE